MICSYYVKGVLIMNIFDFKIDFEKLDDRSIFANRICKLIYNKNKGDLQKSIEEAEPYFKGLDQFVRNIYELIEYEIPLYAYYELIKYGMDNYDFNKKEYDVAIKKTKKACILYYE